MANTVTQRTLFGDASSKLVVRSIHVVSDGTEETDLVIYDNSAFVADVTKGKVMLCHMSGAYTGAVRLEFDATTDVPITSFGIGDGSGDHDFRWFGGIKNPNGTGNTGDILLTTTALAALDEFHLILVIDQS